MSRVLRAQPMTGAGSSEQVSPLATVVSSVLGTGLEMGL